jgi:hypothetical protein
MIRLPDFDPSRLDPSTFGGTQATRPGGAAPGRPAADVKDASGWFDLDPAATDVRITGDVSLAVRGLSVEQHAQRVLAQLCGEPDDAQP